MGPVRGLVQRVTRARVRVGDETVGEIGAGLCLLGAVFFLFRGKLGG